MKTKATPFFTSVIIILSLFSCVRKEEQTNNSTANETEKISPVTEYKMELPEEMDFDIIPDTAFTTNTTPVITERIWKEYKKEIPAEKKETETAFVQANDTDKYLNYYDTLKYNGMIVDYFTTVSKQLGGKPYFAENADELVKGIMEIVTKKVQDGTDVVLLIDKTASMNDDLYKVKNSLDSIYKLLANFDNVKLAVASYGDKNYHQDFWYNRSDLSTDKDILINYMDGYTTIGNPDTPESVNDAIVKTVQEMNWTEGNRRMILVIGDAPSQEPPLSDYSIQDVVNICNDAKVTFNLYPIILSLQGNIMYDTPVHRETLKYYPNPAKDYTTIELVSPQYYFYEILDISGRKMQSGYFNGNSCKIDLNGFSNGTYLIQVYNGDQSIYSTAKLMVQN